MPKRALDGRPLLRTSGLWRVWQGFRVMHGGAGSLGCYLQEDQLWKVLLAGARGPWLLGGEDSVGRRAREGVNRMRSLDHFLPASHPWTSTLWLCLCGILSTSWPFFSPSRSFPIFPRKGEEIV